jgi:hypothetical protein
MIKDPAFYRDEAERARRSADNARTHELWQQWDRLAEAYERLAATAANLAQGDAEIPINSNAQIWTVDDLRKLIGDAHLAGLGVDQIAALIHEARMALRESGGDLAYAEAAVRKLASGMPRQPLKPG